MSCERNDLASYVLYAASLSRPTGLIRPSGLTGLIGLTGLT